MAYIVIDYKILRKYIEITLSGELVCEDGSKDFFFFEEDILSFKSGKDHIQINPLGIHISHLNPNERCAAGRFFFLDEDGDGHEIGAETYYTN